MYGSRENLRSVPYHFLINLTQLIIFSLFFFTDVIGFVYEIGEAKTIKTEKASTKREIQIIDQFNKKVNI